jgi:hypothetical protein
VKRIVAALALSAAVFVGAAPVAADVDPSDTIEVGAAPEVGSLRTLGVRPVSRVLGIAPSATGNGYWNVAGDGGIFAFGDAPFFGSMGGLALNRSMVGMAPTTTGLGYWMFAGDGGIFAFGDATFFGSTGSLSLNAPIVAMAPTASNGGYWLLGADGGVFAYGDATFLGSTGSSPPATPVVAMAARPAGVGYWLVTSAGQVIPYGDAQGFGDLTDKRLSNPVVGMAPTASGLGYWLVQQDGQVWAFGDAVATNLASGARCLDQPVVGLAARPQGDGLWLATAPRPPVVTSGLAPLQQLDAEHADIVARLRGLQACQSRNGLPSMTSPLSGSSITSAYGNRIHPVYRVPQFHRGIDLAGGSGTARAAAAGTIVDVRTRVGYGIAVVVDHGGQVATLYSHLAFAQVTVGQTVARGDAIGRVGSTGFATGPHLHFEVRLGGDVIDPTPLVR